MSTTIYTVSYEDEHGDITTWPNAYRSLGHTKAAVESEDANLRVEIGITNDDIPPCEWDRTSERTWVFQSPGGEWQAWYVRATELHD